MDAFKSFWRRVDPETGRKNYIMIRVETCFGLDRRLVIGASFNGARVPYRATSGPGIR